ncbi:sensor histidine kinase KdpD [Sphingobacterium sp. BIGb0116]|uniref:sensor histidine kinase n=1 Tax=Sphingobacterium sp. BIGb0116 TaxID=2940619 RepID=UPI002167A800|nr:HAMP domain-containing sensor histidine kinase [Sphingobacterium sp. BIGb0116]MCS4167742.1 signal transduction histidine kinase [Sphingobacterium sp. BIGb0116]
MKSTGKNIYPWAFGTSFLILTGLIGFLIFNTYKLEDKNYQIGQLNRIQNAYGAVIMDDKIFPGGDAIFQTTLVPCLPKWYEKKINKSADADQYGNHCMNGFLDQMRRQQSLDSIFRRIVHQQGLDTTLVYLFHFDKLEIYNARDRAWTTFYALAADDRAGLISGKLKRGTNNNRVFQLSVSDKNPIPYRFTYSLYVDYENRDWRLVQRMMPVFLLSLACIVVIVLLSYRTYRNWINQRKLSDLKTSFLNHMRHEFNTPLTTILISAHSLIDRETGKDDKEVAQLGRIVERQAKRLKAYFEQVMGSVALQEQEATIVSVSIDRLTQQILKELHLRYRGEIEIQYEPLAADVEMSLDEDYYFSILDNLVSNAIKFNDNSKKTIQFSWEQQGHHYNLKIVDNGVGIAAADQEAIFTAFYRGKLSGNKPGLGLGLYYVKSYLDRLGWTIQVAGGKSGSGAIFYIYMNNVAFNGKR